MKKVLIFLASCMVFSTAIYAQDLNDLEYVSPFHEGLAAVKKGGQWGFINTEGTMVINYRNDVVVAEDNLTQCCSNDSSKDYPFFKDARCLIKKTKDGIDHYGFINKNGAVVIEPTFLNATHFHGKQAIVLEIYKEVLGKNALLDKNVVSYNYSEIVIDDMGKFKAYLIGPVNLLYDKEELKSTPIIESRFLSPDLFAVKTEKGNWEIRNINLK